MWGSGASSAAMKRASYDGLAGLLRGPNLQPERLTRARTKPRTDPGPSTGKCRALAAPGVRAAGLVARDRRRPAAHEGQAIVERVVPRGFGAAATDPLRVDFLFTVVLPVVVAAVLGARGVATQREPDADDGCDRRKRGRDLRSPLLFDRECRDDHKQDGAERNEQSGKVERSLISLARWLSRTAAGRGSALTRPRRARGGVCL